MSKLKAETNNPQTNLRLRCYFFSISVIQFLEDCSGKYQYRSLNDQLLRSATSVGANIVEAKSSSSRKDFIKFYQIALKSANETKYWLGLYRDGLKIEPAVVNDLLDEIDQISKMLGASIITLKDKKF